jgi:four helix bundle protein
VTFEEWQLTVPDEIRSNALWRMQAYQLGLFVADLSWKDGAKLMREPRTKSVADQLFRAAGNISSNIAEGYSRGTGRDRSRFYEYALGSARETRDWYFKARHVLGAKVIEHRIKMMTQLTKLLVRMSSNERRTNQRLAVGISVESSSRTNHQSPS